MKLKKLSGDERGNVMVLAAIGMMAMLAMAGLVLDGGMLFYTKSHLQKTANAAALSGAQELTGEEAEVTAIVHDVLAAHDEDPSLQAVRVVKGQSVRVNLQKDVPLLFAKIFGIESAPVDAESAAGIGPMARAAGAAPLGIDDSIPLEFGRTYKLKVDETEVDTGVFGILALGGPGAKTYEENLRSGYDEEIKAGDILETETGNIAGKTRTVIQELVNQCPYNEGDPIDRDCSRVLLIPVYKPYNQESNQMKQVEVTGFAYFFITEPMDLLDTAITGMFIKRTGTGFIDGSVRDSGAYGIRLIE
ncbi:TadE/TadG family type IV pilus assembly protein [Bacillus marinisedimentorum]|uniref:TadE/TadG family type IV pilus assembly protein n=1 Tax=Bacillus marinisedimentorum TaxID=1821260 RepID=UPI001FDEE917|nr:TadE/TadG family type IV pilus assembly protein [Bacillus marinisedimentorum]